MLRIISMGYKYHQGITLSLYSQTSIWFRLTFIEYDTELISKIVKYAIRLRLFVIHEIS